MLTWSAGVLSLAALGGLVLVVLSQLVRGYARLRWPGVVHGLLGIGGFALLVAGLGGPPRGVAQGAGSFGVIAAWLVGVTVLLGALVFSGRIRRRPPSVLVVGVHATFAVGGVVMLAAYLST